jgi:hypothetical protein
MPPTKRKAPETVVLHMALDLETRRVLVQDRDFGEGDFPPGLRGAGWPQRTLEVPAAEFAAILEGSISGSEVDRLHRDWWDRARGEGDPMWPNA